MPRFITVGGSSIASLDFADGRHIEAQHGGNAAYSAVGMHVWTASIGIVTSVGSRYPQGEFDLLAKAGIDVSGVRRRKSAREFEVHITYDRDGKRLYEAPRGVLGFLQRFAPGILGLMAGPMWRSLVPQAEDIPPAFLQAEGAIVCASEYESQARIAEALRGRVKTMVLDPPTLVLKPHGTVPKGLVDLSIPDFVLPSEQELFEYFGDGVSPEEGAERLKSLGARNVVVKLGERGSMVYDEARGSWRIVPVYRTRLVDPTGAGDAYGGGFLVGLVETGNPLQAALYGTVSASFVIEGEGGTSALRRTRAEAEGRLRELRAQIGWARGNDESEVQG
ncbi:MAG: carbohydrate kinase family protein [Anaerolineales bacterium]|nr:carbohydrate kinase family protein [Anaerolineales bacterium]